MPAIWETWVRSLGWENSLKKGMATHSSILAWEIPWTEEPNGLQSMGSQRVRHNWVTNAYAQITQDYLSTLLPETSITWAKSFLPCNIFLSLLFYLAMPLVLRFLSSSTRDWTQALGGESEFPCRSLLSYPTNNCLRPCYLFQSTWICSNYLSLLVF